MGANNSSSPDHGPSSPTKGATGGVGLRYSYLFGGKDSAGEGVMLREKKKKISKFATLRKKLARSRRHSKSLDYGKALREMASGWSVKELSSLVDEYESSVALKELAVNANLARPHANTVKEDLSNLYDCKFCTDLDLVYEGVVFPVHRAVLCVRCPFFRELLSRYQEYGVQVPVKIRTRGVDVNVFSILLRYLYTGDWGPTDTNILKYDMLVRLSQEFGTPNPLDQDLRTLLETGIYSDAVISFSSSQPPQESIGCAASTSTDAAEGEGCSLQLHCHKAILAARSPFFRNMLLRRARSGEELTEQTLRSPTHIVLDDSVIPKQYARVLLQCMYLDAVDVSSILQGSVSTSSLCEVQAMVAGKCSTSQADEAMEIYQIGQFIEFPKLVQGCEDIIVEFLNQDSLVSTLQWSSEPYGSQWVKRQAQHYLREEFLHIAQSPVLFDLTHEHLIDALQSDFLQAGELEILNAVLKWGEHQLIKRIEEREPNLLTHTAHSISKKGVKKRDLNDGELREILADILSYLRVEHVIPTNSDILVSAVKRGLVSMPPSHMIGDESSISQGNPWIRSKSSSMYTRPRLFLPYFEEAKSLLEDHMSDSRESDNVRLRMIHLSSVPDTLYMVDSHGYGSMRSSRSQQSMLSACSADIIAVPDQQTLQRMMQRQQDLQQTPLAQRAYSLTCSNRAAITHQIQLRVVREFGLPDSTVEVLHGAAMYTSEENPLLLAEAMYHTPRRHRQVLPESKQGSPQNTSPSGSLGSRNEKEPSTCSDSLLSDVMPDIALATSSLQHASLQEYEYPTPQHTGHGEVVEPDLVDNGNIHYDSKTLYI